MKDIALSPAHPRGLERRAEPSLLGARAIKPRLRLDQLTFSDRPIDDERLKALHVQSFGADLHGELCEIGPDLGELGTPERREERADLGGIIDIEQDLFDKTVEGRLHRISRAWCEFEMPKADEIARDAAHLCGGDAQLFGKIVADEEAICDGLFIQTIRRLEASLGRLGGVFARHKRGKDEEECKSQLSHGSMSLNARAIAYINGLLRFR